MHSAIIMKTGLAKEVGMQRIKCRENIPKESRKPSKALLLKPLHMTVAARKRGRGQIIWRTQKSGVLSDGIGLKAEGPTAAWLKTLRKGMNFPHELEY